MLRPFLTPLEVFMATTTAVAPKTDARPADYVLPKNIVIGKDGKLADSTTLRFAAGYSASTMQSFENERAAVAKAQSEWDAKKAEADKAAAEAKANEGGFFSTVWTIVTYPVVLVGSLFSAIGSLFSKLFSSSATEEKKAEETKTAEAPKADAKAKA